MGNKLNLEVRLVRVEFPDELLPNNGLASTGWNIVRANICMAAPLFLPQWSLLQIESEGPDADPGMLLIAFVSLSVLVDSSNLQDHALGSRNGRISTRQGLGLE